MASASTEGQEKASGTHEGGCHCGYIKFAVTLSPPLPDYVIMDCNCSVCTKGGYLLTYPKREDVKWHGESRERCAVYQFNTKLKDQLFCPKCGTSIGIDFRDVRDGYGISARTFYNTDLKSLKYEYGNGIERVHPNQDLAGTQWEIDEAERKKNESLA